MVIRIEISSSILFFIKSKPPEYLITYLSSGITMNGFINWLAFDSVLKAAGMKVD